MTLSMPLDQATIRTQNITITPSVSGSISLYQDKTIRLTLDAPLDIGTTYSVSLAPEILALSGKPLK